MQYAILAVVLIGLDQLVKALIRTKIPLFGTAAFLPGVLDLTNYFNTGAGFSILEGHTWFLTLISAVLSILLILALWKNFFRHPFGKTSLALVLAGAVGNLIDRALFGGVTDMFRTLFVRFPVINVADICVTLGGIGAMIYYLFLYDKLEENKHDRPDADS